MDSPPSSGHPPPLPAGFHGLIFLAFLLAPGVLTMLAAQANDRSFAEGCPFIGGAISGIVCGIMLARHMVRTLVPRILCALFLMPLFAFFSFALALFGCTLGGGCGK